MPLPEAPHCPLFPARFATNQRVDRLPAAHDSRAIVRSIGLAEGLHADPIPRHVHVEGGSDRHALLLDRSRCRLYELFALRRAHGRWTAGSGATWRLRSTRLRPRGSTSADAAGLPIMPLLARWDEVRRGRIDHALRITVQRTRRENRWIQAQAS